MKKKIYIFFFVFLILFILIYFKISDRNISETKFDSNLEDTRANSNIISDVNYVSKDNKGNEYVINALEGEIDINDTDIIFLKDVEAIIKLKNKGNINITSNYGKYNILNNDTIFNDNVIAKYLENKVTGKYLEFSLKKNKMIISKNVILTTSENKLTADVIEVNIQTKDTKIFMFDSKDRVNIKNKN